MLPLILDGQPIPDKKFIIFRKRYLGDIRDALGLSFVSPFKTNGNWTNPETGVTIQDTPVRNRYIFIMRFPSDEKTFIITRNKITTKAE